MIRRALLARIALCALTLATAMIPAGSAQASGPTLTGAGSTWAAIAIDQWRTEGARLGMNINYQPVGSTAGRQYYIIGQVDFAASEIPFLPSEVTQLKAEHKSYQYLPDVAGGTAIMYNVKTTTGRQVTDLRLSATTIAKIFTGKIVNWDDPAIKADNPGLSLPNEKLTPVIRSDGSGTSAKLADYIAHLAPSIWAPFASQYSATLPVQFWPNFPGSVSVRGSDGMANYISNPSIGGGSIGYVEAGYVYQHSMTPAFIRNKSGHYAAPSSVNVAVALKHVTLNKDLTENLLGAYNAPEANAYPLASYSYLITQTSGFSPAKGAVLGRWIIYIACQGQQDAAPLGYSPLPPNLVADDFAAVRRIPGAPRPPPLTASGCPNPTITGKGVGGGPQDGGGGVSGGSGSTGSSGGGTSTTTAPSGSTTGPSQTTTHHASSKRAQAAALAAAAGGNPTALITIKPLSAAARKAAFAAGVQELAGVRPPGGAAGIAAVLAVLALVAAPLAFLRGPRRSRQNTEGDARV